MEPESHSRGFSKERMRRSNDPLRDYPKARWLQKINSKIGFGVKVLTNLFAVELLQRLVNSTNLLN